MPLPTPGDLQGQRLELLKEYQRNPSTRVRNRLVELNLGLVRKEVYLWVNQCQESYDDLLQVGSVGLIRAVERFDLGKGHAFSSFALPYIRGEIQHYLRDKSYTIKIPRRWLVLHRQARRVAIHLQQDLKRHPTDGELAAALGIDLQEWREIQVACQNQSLLSLDATVGSEDEGSASLADLLPDQRYRDFQLAQEDQMRLQQALNTLEQRTYDILRFVFLYDLTQKETSEYLGLSAVTISRQVKKGLEALRKLLAETHL